MKQNFKSKLSKKIQVNTIWLKKILKEEVNTPLTEDYNYFIINFMTLS
jgi:hypothetical protein